MENYQLFSRHPYARDLKYFGLGALVVLALSALVFFSAYKFNQEAREALQDFRGKSNIEALAELLEK